MVLHSTHSRLWPSFPPPSMCLKLTSCDILMSSENNFESASWKRTCRTMSCHSIAELFRLIVHESWVKIPTWIRDRVDFSEANKTRWFCPFISKSEGTAWFNGSSVVLLTPLSSSHWLVYLQVWSTALSSPLIRRTKVLLLIALIRAPFSVLGMQ